MTTLSELRKSVEAAATAEVYYVADGRNIINPTVLLALIAVAEAAKERHQRWTRDTYTAIDEALTRLNEALS